MILIRNLYQNPSVKNLIQNIVFLFYTKLSIFIQTKHHVNMEMSIDSFILLLIVIIIINIIIIIIIIKTFFLLADYNLQWCW